MKVCAADEFVKVRDDGVNVPLDADRVIVSDVTVEAGVSVKFVDATPFVPDVGPVKV